MSCDLRLQVYPLSYLPRTPDKSISVISNSFWKFANIFIIHCPPPVSMRPGENWPPVSLTRATNLAPVPTTPVITSFPRFTLIAVTSTGFKNAYGKFATGVWNAFGRLAASTKYIHIQSRVPQCMSPRRNRDYSKAVSETQIGESRAWIDNENR